MNRRWWASHECWVTLMATVVCVGALYLLYTADEEEWNRDRGCPCECGE